MLTDINMTYKDMMRPNHQSGGTLVFFNKELFDAWKELYNAKLTRQSFQSFAKTAVRNAVDETHRKERQEARKRVGQEA